MWVDPVDLGLTLPLVELLANAYGQRRLRELREDGSVTAFAVNEPGRLSEILKDNTAKAVAGRWWEDGEQGT